MRPGRVTLLELPLSTLDGFIAYKTMNSLEEKAVKTYFQKYQIKICIHFKRASNKMLVVLHNTCTLFLANSNCWKLFETYEIGQII